MTEEQISWKIAHFYNHLRHSLNRHLNVEVTDENIKKLCLDSLTLKGLEYEDERERNEQQFCVSLEKDLREKRVIDEYETIEYYTLITE